MLNRMKKENGSITVEATISLTAFMFAIVTVLTILNICIVQARMAVAINTTAKELSQYSYLYSLTGINNSEAKLHENGKKDVENIDTIMTNINTVYNEIQNIGGTMEASADNIDEISAKWDDMVGSGQKIEEAGSKLEDAFGDIASDPKKIIFGMAKLAGSEGLEFGKSRLIAAPLSKVLCKKHLVSAKGGSAEEYLKHLGVVPSATGSYVDGLDFSQSTLFPYGSNEIRVNVRYKVKVIALLPIDFEFTFNQTAITHGWLAGESTSQTSKQQYIDTDTLWTKATITERSDYIRHMGINELCSEGYVKVKGLTDVQLYNSEKNEFVMISSMNPLYSAEGEAPMTLDDISDAAIIEAIDSLCGKISSTTDGLNKVTTTTKVDGSIVHTENICTGASNRVVLVIPEDEGLKEKIEELVAQANTRGVVVEIVASYGKGVNKTVDVSQGGE